MNLLIVDDEKLTRECLLEFVEWVKFGISSISTAANGVAAYRLALKEKPDILLCDVRMPKMDGIELATKIKELYPNCKIIFISGYCDKEYLKSAIALKAEQYIEKPITQPELEKVISEVTLIIQEEDRKKQNDQILVSSLVRNTPIVNQEIALGLIQHGYKISNLTEKFGEFYFNWKNYSCYIATCVRSFSQDGSKADKNVVLHQLYTFLKSSRCQTTLDFYAGQTLSGDIALITHNVSETTLENSLLPALLAHLSETTGFAFTIGLGTNCESLDKIPSSFVKACKAVDQLFYLGRGRVIPYVSHFAVAPISNVQALLAEIDNQQLALLDAEQLFNGLEKNKPQDVIAVKDALYKLYLAILKQSHSIENECAKEEFDFLTLEELKSLICNKDLFMQQFSEEENYNSKVREAAHFIRENYSNSELSIKMVAEKVDISQNYLCTLFKQNTDSTINDYIITVRLKKAEDLLRKTDLRLYEISVQVGISDPNYLSSIFKYHMGITPSEYRRKEGGGHH